MGPCRVFLVLYTLFITLLYLRRKNSEKISRLTEIAGKPGRWAKCKNKTKLRKMKNKGTKEGKYDPQSISTKQEKE